jgi:hypothetical protein
VFDNRQNKDGEVIVGRRLNATISKMDMGIWFGQFFTALAGVDSRQSQLYPPQPMTNAFALSPGMR